MHEISRNISNQVAKAQGFVFGQKLSNHLSNHKSLSDKISPKIDTDTKLAAVRIGKKRF